MKQIKEAITAELKETNLDCGIGDRLTDTDYIVLGVIASAEKRLEPVIDLPELHLMKYDADCLEKGTPLKFTKKRSAKVLRQIISAVEGKVK